MTELKLESRPLYSIGTVARLTGIKTDTLRAWERRYGLGASQKSARGRREYSQSDLEHLQIVAALLEQGSKIGDIANSDRKTLEVMRQGRQRIESQSLSECRPRFLFVGEQLSNWVDEHQGCIANVSAFIARRSIESAMAAGSEEVEEFDAVFFECRSLEYCTKQTLEEIRARFGTELLVACNPRASEHWIEEMARNGVTLLSLPLQPGRLANEINRCFIHQTSRVGDNNAGKLVSAKPRYFSESALQQAAAIDPDLHCACPNHISKLVTALNEFEDYSSQCAVDSWKDAAVHTCVYAYTSQARWLLEKALQAVLEEEGLSIPEGTAA